MNKGRVVSIIITTKNEETVLAKLILSLKEQTYPYKEIILVDNNSTDKTLAIAQKMGAKTYTFGPERSAQRNFGAGKSKGNYLFFVDADMRLTANVVEECVQKCLKDKEIGAVIIPEQSIGSNFWERVKAFERSFYNQYGDEITDAARFFRKETFNKVGGYDELITGPEDWDLPERIKMKEYKIGRIKSVIYHYEKIDSLFNLAKKKFYYGLKSHRYLSKQNIAVFSPKTVYFLRPVFYKNFNKLISHPILAISMFFMFTIELLSGGLGYLVGKSKKL